MKIPKALLVGLCISTMGWAYRRLTYIHYNFTPPIAETDPVAERIKKELDDVLRCTTACTKKCASYSVQHTESRQDIIYLSRLDRWRIARSLRFYTLDTLVTPELVHQVTAPLWGKRRVVVQHVLHDFTKKPGTTVGSLLRMLDIELVS